MGGVEARTIPLEACDADKPAADALAAVKSGGCPRGKPRTLMGVLRIALDIAKKGQLTVSYLRSEADEEVPASEHFAVVEPGEATVKAGELRVLTLRFAVPQGKGLSTVNGTVFVKHGDTRFPLPVKAPAAELKVVPATVPIECTFGGDGCETTTVTLTGTAVPQLVENVVEKEEITVELRKDLHTATAKIDEITPDGTDALKATARVRITDDGIPGRTYKGTAELLPGEKPVTLDIELKHGFSGWIPFIVILIGVLFGALLPRVRSHWRRQKLLRAELDAAVDQYETRLKRIGGNPASYRLKDLVDFTPNGPPAAVAELRTAIATARNDADLDEDTTRVLDLIARLQRWLRVEPAAQRFDQVATSQPHQPGTGQKAWKDTRTWHDSLALRAALHDEPKDADAADDLVARVLWQIQWHHRMERAWNHVAEGKGNVTAKQLDEVDAKLTSSPVLDRTASQRAELEADLDRLTQDLDIPDLGAPEGADVRSTVLGDVNWQAPSFNFRGWATLNGPQYKQLKERVSNSGRDIEAQRPARKTEEDSTVGSTVRRLFSGTIHSLPAILLACTVYFLGVYDDSWGSAIDFLTALIAGAAGKIVIDWAGLPLFRSVRLRKPAS